MKFQNKVAVVTGAGGTLCSAISVDLAKKGAKVVLVGRTKEKLDAVLSEINAFGGTAVAFCCDVTDQKSVAELAAAVEETYGACSMLVIGAGGNNTKAMPTITQFDRRELTKELPEGERGLTILTLMHFARCCSQTPWEQSIRHWNLQSRWQQTAAAVSSILRL